jgi:hypothetical protein
VLFLALPMKWGVVMKIRCVRPNGAAVTTTPTLAGRRSVNHSRNLMIIRRNNIHNEYNLYNRLQTCTYLIYAPLHAIHLQWKLLVLF